MAKSEETVSPTMKLLITKNINSDITIDFPAKRDHLNSFREVIMSSQIISNNFHWQRLLHLFVYDS